MPSPTVVQFKGAVSWAAIPWLDLPVTPDAPTTTGNSVLVFTRAAYGAQTAAPTDGTNTYVALLQAVGTDPLVEVWIAENITGTAAAVHTTWPSSNGYLAMCVVEVTGGDPAAWIDLVASGILHVAGAATDMTSDPFTTARAGALVLVCASQDASFVATAGADFTLVTGDFGGGGQLVGLIEQYTPVGTLAG
ncbi:MAG TPA: hypothetical protein VM487_12080, partial [Phycisphaerae bacterium]|nr:hypothetical protein [Phycisphaerae bacterium]